MFSWKNKKSIDVDIPLMLSYGYTMLSCLSHTLLQYDCTQDADVHAVNSDQDSPRHTLQSSKADSLTRPSSGKNSKAASLDREGKKSKNASLGELIYIYTAANEV